MCGWLLSSVRCTSRTCEREDVSACSVVRKWRRPEDAVARLIRRGDVGTPRGVVVLGLWSIAAYLFVEYLIISCICLVSFYKRGA